MPASPKEPSRAQKSQSRQACSRKSATPSPPQSRRDDLRSLRRPNSFLSMTDFSTGIGRNAPLSSPQTSSSPSSRPMLPYTEVLFHPELLQRVKSQSGSMSSNPLLEFCLDGGQVKWDKEDSRGEQAVLEAAHPRHPLLHPILEICARSQFTFHDLKTLETLVRGCRDFSSPSLGCDIHALDLDGNSAMHLLVKSKLFSRACTYGVSIKD